MPGTPNTPLAPLAPDNGCDHTDTLDALDGGCRCGYITSTGVGTERGLTNRLAKLEQRADEMASRVTGLDAGQLKHWTTFFSRWADIFQLQGVSADEAVELWPADEQPDDQEQLFWPASGFRGLLNHPSFPTSAPRTTRDAVLAALLLMSAELVQEGRNEAGYPLWQLRSHADQKGDGTSGAAARPGCPHLWVDQRAVGLDLAVPICSYCHVVDWEIFIPAVAQFTEAAATAAIQGTVPAQSLVYATTQGQLIRVDTAQAPSDPRERAILLGLLGHAKRMVRAVDQQQLLAPGAGQASLPR